MPYFSGQGRIYIAERSVVTPGQPDVYRFVGNSPQFDLEVATEVLQHKESTTGQRRTDLRLLQETTSSLTLVLEEFDAANLALALFGEDSALTGGSVTDEVLAGGSTNVANGDYVSLAEPNASSIVINDSDATPATLTEGTDYRVVSAAHGTIEILDIGSYVQPFTATYTSGAATNINMATQPLTEKYVKFDGINTADNGKEVIAEIYRASFDPSELLSFIGDEVAQFTLNGSALIDDTKEGDAVLGQFGRVVLLP